MRAHTQVLISCRNNRKLLARVKAFDRHCNMVLENVKEMWTEAGPRNAAGKRGRPVNKDRFVSKMYVGVLFTYFVHFLVFSHRLNPFGQGGPSTFAGGWTGRRQAAALTALQVPARRLGHSGATKLKWVWFMDGLSIERIGSGRKMEWSCCATRGRPPTWAMYVLASIRVGISPPK